MRKTIALLLVLTACGEKHAPGTKIMVIGDSTAAPFRPITATSKGGWASYFGDYLPMYMVINAAIGGKSSKSYSEYFMPYLFYFEPKVVFIQFGHNDMKPEPERHTDPQTTFKVYLHEYVKDIRNKKAVPVLITPSERTYHTGCVSDHYTGEYAIAMREYAASESIQLIDLHAHSVELMEADCFTASVKKIYSDTVHLTPAGSKLYAKFIAEEFLKGSN